MPADKRKSRELLRIFGRVSHLGFQLIISAAVFTLLGWHIDEKLGSSPFLLIAGLLLGNTVGIYSIYRQTVVKPVVKNDTGNDGK